MFSVSPVRELTAVAVYRDAFDLHRAEVEEWHCQFLLDDALSQTSQSGPASLQAACTILPGGALSFA